MADSPAARTPSTAEHGRRPGAQLPEGYSASDYPAFAVTVDIVIMTLVSDVVSVLLVRRGGDPFAGMWALPGGFKHPDETLDAAAARELAEETGLLPPGHLEQFRAYGDPGRDPRLNVVTVAYLAVVTRTGVLTAGTDADDAALHPLGSVLNGEVEVAFDHHRIIADAAAHVAERLETSDLATAFVPEAFTLTQLRRVYEQFWNERLDAANFRRSLISDTLNYVEATDERSAPSSRGGRPAELFIATEAWRLAPGPIRRRRRNYRQ